LSLSGYSIVTNGASITNLAGAFLEVRATLTRASGSPTNEPWLHDLTFDCNVDTSSLSVAVTNPVNRTIFTRSQVLLTATTAGSLPVDHVQFFVGTNAVGYGVNTGTNYQVPWTAGSTGSVVIRALATATNGTTAWSAPVTNLVVTIPTVIVTSPTNDFWFTNSPTNLTITATATNVSGASITNVEFYWAPSGALIGHDTTAPYSIATNLPAGDYNVIARAYDTNGGMGVSWPIAFSIASNSPPQVNPGPNQIANIGINGSVLVDLPGFVADDGLPSNSLLVNWTNLTGGANVSFVSTNLPHTSAYFYSTGTFALTLSASDSQFVVSSNITVTILTSNLPPIVNAGTDAVVILPALASRSPVPWVEITQITNITDAAGGVDYLVHSNAVIMSSSLSPGLYLLHPNGTRTTFCSYSGGLNIEEAYIATSKSTNGGFAVGETFAAFGLGEHGVDPLYPAEVMRISPSGSVVGNLGDSGSAWAILTNNVVTNKDVIMAVWVDETGAWGGDLIAATTAGLNGNVWRINSSGQVSLVAQLHRDREHVYFEGITTIPNDPFKYGPWAGRIIVGGDYSPLFAIDTNGVVTAYDLGFGAEDIRIIPPNQNLYMADDEHRFWTVRAEEFTGMAGDILIVDEITGKLHRMHWNGTAFEVVTIGQTPFFEPEVGQASFAPPGLLALPGVTQLELSGSVIDDHHLLNSPVVKWLEVSGPGKVTFQDSAKTNTLASFSEPGSYWLRLTAYDGQFSTNDDVHIQVLRNEPPIVSAGSNMFIGTLSTNLTGSVTDDGWPKSQTNLEWRVISTPPGAEAWITNSTSLSTPVGFSAVGVYIFRLTADDGAATNISEVRVTVNTPSLTITAGDGWPTGTDVPYTVQALLVDASNHPIGLTNVQFAISNAETFSVVTNFSVATDSNGYAVFTYPHIGYRDTYDYIFASADVGGGNVLQANASKFWAVAATCGVTVTDNTEETALSVTLSNRQSSYYVANLSAGIPVGIETSGEGPVVVRDPQRNIEFATMQSQFLFTPKTSGTYLFESIFPPNSFRAAGDLTLRCGSFGLGVLHGTNNLNTGSTAFFTEATTGTPVAMTLVLTNLGSSSISLTAATLTGDFSFSNSVVGTTLYTSDPTSTNLVIFFNASSNETSYGELTLHATDPALLYEDEIFYKLYLVGSASPPGSGPTVQITSPTNGVKLFAPENIILKALVNAGDSPIAYVDFRLLTTNGAGLIGTSTNLVGDTYDVTWSDVPAGDYQVDAVAVDTGRRFTNSIPISIQVRETAGNLPPTAIRDQYTVNANSQNNIFTSLSNDSDPDGDKLKIIRITQPPNGYAAIIQNGTGISYTPKVGLHSTSNGVVYPGDGFTYWISDNRGGTNFAGILVGIKGSELPSVEIHYPASDGYTTNAGSIVPLTAAVVPYDYITNVEFYFGPNRIGNVTNGTGGLFTLDGWHAISNACNCGITAVAYDMFGQVNTSAPRFISVNPPVDVFGSPLPPPVASFETYTNCEGVRPLTNGVVIRDGLIGIKGRAYHASSSVVWQLGVYTPDGTLVRDLTPLSHDTNGANTIAVGDASNVGFLNTNADLTTLANGVYNLRLSVIGAYVASETNIQFQLDSNLKIGQFSFSQQDLTIPVNGIPLTVIRNYNSLNPLLGDFGYGWTMALNDMQVEFDETRMDVLDFDDEPFSMRVGGGRDVTLTLPDGRRTTFYYNLRQPNGLNLGTCYAEWSAAPGVNYSLVPLEDNRLQALEAATDEGQPYWEAADPGLPMENFDFSGFRLSSTDGTDYYITRDNLNKHYLPAIDPNTEEPEDPPKDAYLLQAWGPAHLSMIVRTNGDSIIISKDGIEHRNATNRITQKIQFQRNSDGQIIAISDPQGQNPGDAPAVKYEYDSRKNLINVLHLVNRAGSGAYTTNVFAYTNSHFPHYITAMIDPRGVLLAHNEYDDQGRLIAVVDANGKRTEFDHTDVGGRIERVSDRLGRTNVIVYDTRGNVEWTTNALKVITRMAYDDLNNKIAETNAFGTTYEIWTTNGYDALGNITNIVDALHTNAFTYDSNCRLIQQRDGVGNMTTNVYDDAGNLTSIVQLDPSGSIIETSSSRYDSGYLVETKNGPFTNGIFGYDGAGNLTSSTDASGMTRNFAYDLNGNQTNSSYIWVGPSGSVTVGSSVEYDASGRVVRTRDVLGFDSLTIYNPVGKIEYTVNRLGNTNRFVYDARGNVIENTGPDGLPIRTVYDDDGKAVVVTDQNQMTGTHTEYDAVGRTTNMVRFMNLVVSLNEDPSNEGHLVSKVASWGYPFSTNSVTYDPNGRALTRTGPNGQTTRYQYYSDGQLRSIADALNHTNSYEYDAAGRQKAIIDALNRTNRLSHDALGRLIKTTFADTTWTSNIFNNVGQRIAQIDQASNHIDYAYSVSGQLTNVLMPEVFDALTNSYTHPSWQYEYDTYGGLIATTDANGHSNSNTYDAFGRLVSKQIHSGKYETLVYNSLGQLWQKVDFSGQSNRFAYDALGRLRAKFYFAAGSSYPSNAVCYQYNSLGRLWRIVERSGDDVTTNSCDGYASIFGFPHLAANNRGLWTALAAVPQDVLGFLTGGALVGLLLSSIPRERRRRLAFALFDFVRTYQPEARPSRQSRLPSSIWRLATAILICALLGSDPKLALWSLHAECAIPTNLSSDSNRITEFTYDFDGHLTQVNCPEGVINYTYDMATGQHLTTCTKNSEIHYGYDVLGRLLNVTVVKRNGVSVSETSTYDYWEVGTRKTLTLPNGEIAAYQYDSLNRLTNLTHKIGTTNLATYQYLLDATGRRTNALEDIRQESGSTINNSFIWKYDKMYRLTNEVLSCSLGATHSYDAVYKYDKVGNRINRLRTVNGNTETVKSVFDEDDKLLREEITELNSNLSTNFYSYDLNGSLIGRTNVRSSTSPVTVSYSYNLANKLSSSTVSGLTTTYLYNDQGIRVRSSVGGSSTHFLIDPNNHTGFQQILEELSTVGGTASRSYIIGDDVIGQATSGEPTFLLHDGHGNTRQVMRDDVTSHYHYDAYGNTLDVSYSNVDSSLDTYLRYCGEQYDSTLEMYNLRARFYQPQSGTFIQRDFTDGRHDDPLSLHKYAYCPNADPVNAIDPSGNEGIIQTLVVIALKVVGFTVRWWPVIKLGFSLWDAITIIRIVVKIFEGEQPTVGDWVQFGLATVGLLAGPGTKWAAKGLLGAKFGVAINASLRTVAGAKRAVSGFCHLEEVKGFTNPLQVGGFLVDVTGPVIRFVRQADEFKTARTIFHEFFHYWHWRMAGRPTGKAYEVWEAGAKAFEESTKAQFQLADGSEGFFAALADLFMQLTK
jgi:RHS repeat-associated protein